MGSVVQRIWLTTIQLGKNERRDYTHNWAPTLEPIEDTIKELRCFINDEKTGEEVDSGLELWNDNYTELDTTMWLEKPTPGLTRAATFVVATRKGRIFEASIRVIGVLR